MNYFVQGTDFGGVYRTLYVSPKLGAFLTERGAKNPDYTLSVINEIAAGYTKLSANEDAAVAFRYVPMHLGKRQDMPARMQAVYTVAYSGDEHRERATQYSYIGVMSKQELMQPGEVSYMDRIFGAHVPTWMDAKNLREGRVQDPWSQRFAMKMGQGDFPVVLAVLTALYDKKTVILRTESGISFNERANDLLGQIYGMMDPRLAVESGFAAYQSPSAIRALVDSAGVRIFVIPADAEQVSLAPDWVELDLNNKQAISPDKDSELSKALQRWNSLVGTKGMAQFAPVFAEDTLKKFFGDSYTAGGYLEPQQYLAVTEAFFEQFDDIRKHGATPFESTESMKAFHDAHPLLIPMGDWYESWFARFAGPMVANTAVDELCKGVTLRDAAGNGMASATPMNRELAAFSAGVLGQAKTLDLVGYLAQTCADKQASLDAGYRAEAVTKAEAAKDVIIAERDAAIAESAAKHAAEVATLTAAKDAVIVEKENEIAEKAKKHAEALAAKEAEKQEALTALATAKDAEIAAKEETIAARDKTILDNAEAHKTEIAALEQKHMEALAAKDAEKQGALTALATAKDAVIAAKEETIAARDKTILDDAEKLTATLVACELEKKKALLTLTEEKDAVITEKSRTIAERDSAITALTTAKTDAESKRDEALTAAAAAKTAATAAEQRLAKLQTMLDGNEFYAKAKDYKAKWKAAQEEKQGAESKLADAEKKNRITLIASIAGGVVCACIVALLMFSLLVQPAKATVARQETALAEQSRAWETYRSDLEEYNAQLEEYKAQLAEYEARLGIGGNAAVSAPSVVEETNNEG